MIQALLDWAVGHWHIVESRTVLLTISRADGPVSPLGLDPRRFIALLEGLVRESPDFSSETLDDLYASAREDKVRQAAAPEEQRAARNADIARLSQMFA